MVGTENYISCGSGETFVVRGEVGWRVDLLLSGDLRSPLLRDRVTAKSCLIRGCEWVAGMQILLER